MSSFKDFEIIVSGQLPPDEWYESRCDQRFLYLEPNSGAGRRAMELTGKFEEAKWVLDREWAERIFTESEFRELNKRRLEAEKEWDIAYDLYSCVRKAVQAQTPYEEAVMGASDQIRGKLENDRYHSSQRKKALLRLLDVVTIDYRLETGCHFRALTDTANPS